MGRVNEDLLPLETVCRLQQSANNQHALPPLHYYQYVRVNRLTIVDGELLCILDAPLVYAEEFTMYTIASFPVCQDQGCVRVYHDEEVAYEVSPRAIYIEISPCPLPKRFPLELIYHNISTEWAKVQLPPGVSSLDLPSYRTLHAVPHKSLLPEINDLQTDRDRPLDRNDDQNRKLIRIYGKRLLEAAVTRKLVTAGWPATLEEAFNHRMSARKTAQERYQHLGRHEEATEVAAYSSPPATMPRQPQEQPQQKMSEMNALAKKLDQVMTKLAKLEIQSNASHIAGFHSLSDLSILFKNFQRMQSMKILKVTCHK
ncbi:hypothetical protein CAPTEDRAFT_212429 [Capitella teleta]|uniref:Uncharacterized protein n=1 Tax=Capitella teleta TaxID=283909 RepID=R7UEK6_CAPTE|nr:hypothetical protein CAPTEDRAFT_212429 [Capitella teleta]|eukprot:ELU02218.1 hypothetical protein CAPTEDRAFT_212429 [Capitella teleta]